MKGRSSLHYGVYLVAGVLVTSIALITLAVGDVVSPEAMQVFAGIGAVFILIGLVKLVIANMSKIKHEEKQFATRLAGIPENNRQQHARQTTQPVIKSCPRCETPNYVTSNYCHMCGLRLK